MHCIAGNETTSFDDALCGACPAHHFVAEATSPLLWTGGLFADPPAAAGLAPHSACRASVAATSRWPAAACPPTEPAQPGQSAALFGMQADCSCSLHAVSGCRHGITCAWQWHAGHSAERGAAAPRPAPPAHRPLFWRSAAAPPIGGPWPKTELPPLDWKPLIRQRSRAAAVIGVGRRVCHLHRVAGMLGGSAAGEGAVLRNGAVPTAVRVRPVKSRPEQ